jgi:hypothetical protein
LSPTFSCVSKSLGRNGGGSALGLASVSSVSPTQRSFTLSASSLALLSSVTPNLEFGAWNDFVSIEDDNYNYNATVVIGQTDLLQQIVLDNWSSILNPISLGDCVTPVPKVMAQSMMKAMEDKKGGSSSTLLLPSQRSSTANSSTSSDSSSLEDDKDDSSDNTVHKLSIGGLACKDISRYNHPMSVH